MNNLIGSYGYIKSDNSVISCSDTAYNPEIDGWWCTYLLCISDNGQQVILRNSENSATITIERDGYDVLGFPMYEVGNNVIVKCSGKRATIRCVCWHEKRQRFYYKLSYANRNSNNWFFDDDIEAI